MTGIFRLLVLIGLFVAVYFGYRAYRRWRHKQTVKEFKKAPVRDVSTVANEGQASLKTEKIKIGGPLKPNHRRLALRDDRLLPKPPLGPDYYSKWPRPPKPVGVVVVAGVVVPAGRGPVGPFTGIPQP